MGNRKKVSYLNQMAITANQYISARGTPQAAEIEENLKKFLSELRLDHLNINPKTLLFEPGKIYCWDIFECPRFNFSVFIFGKGARIPLHDHPDMTVMSKVLFGSCHFTSLDWLPTKFDTSKMKVRAAMVTGNQEVNESSEPRVLYPKSNGNLHEIFSPECAVLFDLLLPPYSDEEGRDCHYFHPIVAHDASAEASPPKSTSPIQQASPNSGDSALPLSPSHSHSGDLNSGSPTVATLQANEASETHSTPPSSPAANHISSSKSGSENGTRSPMISLPAPVPQRTSQLFKGELSTLKLGTSVLLISHEPEMNFEPFDYTGPQVDGSLVGK